MTVDDSELTQNAAESLLSCIQQMAEAETNPVLQVINPEIPLEENKKYPAGLLQFNQSGWRAYYHCHPSSRAGNHRFQGEHGHFHIFVRTQPEKWSHLAALAIDNMGQPLGWFTVNHWVTGEKWVESSVLIQFLAKAPFDKQSSVVEQWILSLLVLSRETVISVLQERDEVIEIHKNKITSKKSNIKQDKNLYLLSELPINLEDLLGLNLT